MPRQRFTAKRVIGDLREVNVLTQAVAQEQVGKRVRTSAARNGVDLEKTQPAYFPKPRFAAGFFRPTGLREKSSPLASRPRGEESPAVPLLPPSPVTGD